MITPYKVVLLLLALSCSQLPAEKKHPLHQPIQAIQSRSDMPGLAVTVTEGDKTLLSYVEGLRAIDHVAKVAPEDPWHIGSCTKPMTAFLIGMLVDQKKLAWTSRLADVIPKDVKLHASLSAVTLEQLLTHRSGLAEVTQAESGKLWPTLFTSEPSSSVLRDRLARALLAMPAQFKPGEKFDYSNSGYVILGWLTEKLWQRTWEESMRQEIFNKLAMKSCGFGPAGQDNLRSPTAPWPHESKDGKLQAMVPGVQSDNPPALGPAGTVHCNEADWRKFLRQFFPEAQGLVSETTRQKLLSTREGELITFSSMGRKKAPWAQGHFFTMAGSNTLNYAFIAVVPARARIYTITTNAASAKTGMGVMEVFKLLLGMP